MFFYCGCKVEIFAPKLSYFVLQKTCPGEAESFVLHFPALETAFIDARLPRSRKKEVNNKAHLELFKMLQGLSRVQNLRLSRRTIEVLTEVPGILAHQPSPFCRLEALKIDREENSLCTPQNVVNYFLSGSESDREYERILKI
ncbi:hypothetical protein DITRI_Ditri07aG0163400 [Diplodiscus trichospermus]